MTMISTVGNSTANQNTTQTAASNKLTADMQTFLKLLTTQLKNQDPTNPMDPKDFTEQLVQFSQIEQQIQQTGKLDQILAALDGSKSSDALAYIGKEVQAMGNVNYLEDGEAKFSYGVPKGAVTVEIKVYDADGKVVYTGTGDTSFGRHDFTWDGKTTEGVQKPDGGAYKIEVTAKDAKGEKLETDVLVRGVVDAVETMDGKAYLVIGKLGIDPDDVVLSRQPSDA